jgi:RND family efflux transporter MFP subunit
MHRLANNHKRLVILLGLFFATTMSYAEEYKAVLDWSRRVPLSTLSNGVVADVFVDIGDRVKQSDLMLQLDPVLFEERVKQTAVALKSANENFLEAKRERERSEELYNRTVLSDHELQVAKNNLVSAKADLEQARLKHEQAKYDYKYSRIVAPFNALVLERNVQPGQVVSSELQPITLLVVADSDRMRARIKVKEEELPRFKMKQPAKVSVGELSFDGKIVAIGFEPIKGSGGASEYPVDIEFDTAQQVLRAGLSGKVVIQ